MRSDFAQSMLACIVLLACAASSHGQINNSEAQRIGMELAWSAQLQMPLDGRGIVSADLWTDPKTPPRQYAVVELSDRTIRVPADMRDRRGNPIGIEEAKKQAAERAARLLGRPTGFEVVEVNVPHVKLVVLTKDGMVQTFDAETGNLLWMKSCGLSCAPAYPADISPAGVSVVHGEDLYLLDLETGQQLVSKRLRHGNSNAVSVCNEVAFVGDFSHRVEAYSLKVEDIRPWTYIVNGRPVGQPVSLADQSFSAIATDEGYVYVFTSRENPTVWIRYQAPGRIIGSLSAGNGAFYVGSAQGTLAKVTTQDRVGRVDWEFRTGQAISSPAFVSGKEVFVATEAGELFAIDDETAMTRWVAESGRAVAVLGRAANRVFFSTTAGEIAAIDAASGDFLAASQPHALALPIVNSTHDRLYVASTNGLLQCLRPIGAALPTFQVPVMAGESQQPQPAESSPVAEPPSSGGSPFENMGTGAPAAEGNPFGGTDPFGGGATSGAGTSDPNPFGGDPFGGP